LSTLLRRHCRHMCVCRVAALIYVCAVCPVMRVRQTGPVVPWSAGLCRLLEYNVYYGTMWKKRKKM